MLFCCGINTIYNFNTAEFGNRSFWSYSHLPPRSFRSHSVRLFWPDFMGESFWPNLDGSFRQHSLYSFNKMFYSIQQLL